MTRSIISSTGQGSSLGGRWRVPFARVLICWLAAMFFIVSSCTVDRRYTVLSFLFDGVPRPGEGDFEAAQKPDSSRVASGGESALLPLIPHAPWGNRKCDSCHPKNVLMIRNRGRQPGFCFQCHEHKQHKALFGSYTYLHGPVAVEACLDCHEPHKSRYPGLAQAPDPELCYRCHSRDAMLELPGHSGRQDETCLPCHDPHGGNERYFLRARKEL